MSALYKRTFGTEVDGSHRRGPGRAGLGAQGHRPGQGRRRDVHRRHRRAKTLLHDVYQRFESRRSRTPTSTGSPRGIFNTLVTRQVEPVKVLRKLGELRGPAPLPGVERHPEEQRELAEKSAGGELPRDTGAGPARRAVPQRRDRREDRVLPRLPGQHPVGRMHCRRCADPAGGDGADLVGAATRLRASPYFTGHRPLRGEGNHADEPADVCPDRWHDHEADRQRRSRCGS